MATRTITPRRANKLAALINGAEAKAKTSKEIKERIGEDPDSVDPASYYEGMRSGIVKVLDALNISYTVDANGNWIIKD